MNRYKFLGLLLVAAGFVGCDDFLEQPEPAQDLPSSSAFERVQDLQAALVGAYDGIQTGANLIGDYHTNTEMVANIMSDNGEWRGSFPSYIDVYNRQMTSDNAEANATWRNGYGAINQANLVLAALETLEDPNLTPEIEGQLRAEALFIRGMVHFELVRLYALPWNANSGASPGIPLITEPVSGTADITFPPRATVAEIYDQAERDLETAANSFPTSEVEYGRANRFAALGYLAEIAFQQGRYADAAELAGQVIAGPFSLTPEPVGAFINEGSSEEIFAISNTTQDNPGVNGSLTTFHHLQGRGGDVIVSQDLKANGFDAIVTAEQEAALAAQGQTVVDLRFTQLVSINPMTGVLNIEKYEDFAGNGDDAMIQRLAEYILMRAEALARTQGVNQESVDLLNQIRARALVVQNAAGEPVGDESAVLYEVGDFASADELIEAIILERRVELAFEGNRIHDLKRLARDVRGLPYNNGFLIFPIPQREIDANGMLTQNEGY